MRFKGVLFDLWETLIVDHKERSQPRRGWRTEGVRSVLRAYGFEIDYEEIASALDTASRGLTQLHDRGLDVDSTGRAHLFMDTLDGATGRRAPREAAVDLLEVIAAMPLDLAPQLAADAVETVFAIREQGLKTALVSNAGFTTAPNLRLLLDHYGLSELFDVLVFSDELEIAKPDPRIFEQALAGLGLRPADCAFVGDNPHTDISGALSAGLFTVQIGAKSLDGIRPDARIDSLSQLIPAITAAPS
jgi:HAD superfamily hydrolase (TIGR01509 family)